MIAELAKRARGRVLVLAHVKELVAQNHAKYCAYGLEADIFAAGLQQKESAGKVVFGSVQSVARNLPLFDGAFSLLIVDECHRISDDDDSQYQQIIQHLQKTNPQLRLLGLTATPYRLGKGWIYQYHYHGFTRGDGASLFRDCIYELPLRYMIKNGFLVPPERLDMPIVQYDFSRLEARSNGLFSEADLNRELKRQNRVTPHIISQIVEYAEDRKGVMIFAATVEHAREIHGLLPTGEAALVSAETPAAERDALIEAFKQQRLRYLVNVAVLTTGFDAPHVDLIAILRPTESVSLYQQIVGRGLRLAPGKEDCLISTTPATRTTCSRRRSASASRTATVNRCRCSARPAASPTCSGASAPKTATLSSTTAAAVRAGWRTTTATASSAITASGSRAARTAARRTTSPRALPSVPGGSGRSRRHAESGAEAERRAGAALRRHGLQSGRDDKGEWLKATYYDEDGTSTSERFRLQTPAQRKAFEMLFLRPHQRAPGVPFAWHTAADVLAQQQALRHPDFVVARKRGQFWQVREKVFDYQGRFRRANQLA